MPMIYRNLRGEDGVLYLAPVPGAAELVAQAAARLALEGLEGADLARRLKRAFLEGPGAAQARP